MAGKKKIKDKNQNQELGAPDQSEVDALLATVYSGDSKEPASEEIHVEFEIVKGEIDFDIRQLLRGIENKIERSGFCFRIEERLKEISEKDVSVKLVSAEDLTFSEVIMSLPNPTAYREFKFGGQTGIFEMNPSIFYPLISRHPRRDITIPDASPLRNSLGRQKWDEMSSGFLKIYGEFMEMDLVAGEVGYNPLMIGEKNSVAFMCFEAEYGDFHGILNIAIPLLPLALKDVGLEMKDEKVYEVFYGGLSTESLTRLVGGEVILEVNFGKASKPVDEAKKAGLAGTWHLERSPRFAELYANGMFVGTGWAESRGGTYTLTLIDLEKRCSYTEKKIKDRVSISADVKLVSRVPFGDFYDIKTGQPIDVGSEEAGAYLFMGGRKIGNTFIDKNYADEIRVDAIK